MSITLYELAGSDANRPFSPHCWKTVMSLAHKGLEFTTVATAFTAIPNIEDGATKRVPLIRDGNRLVSDSYAIAEYLDETYPDRPSLFAGKGGQSLTRFVESWTQNVIHPFAGSVALMEIHDMLAPIDQVYFRESREKIYGMKLEDVPVGREQRLEEFLKKLQPLRALLTGQNFIGGESPLFADYIVFGAFQWLRICSAFPVLPAGDPVADWFDRCLDLHDGLARRVPAAAAL